MTTSEKLDSLRKLMKQHNLSAYIIPSTDPHQGEYIPERWKTREWFSGFSGSAGTVVVTADFAGLWTDSRYFIQAEEQLKGSGISLMKLKVPHTPEYIQWLEENLPKGSRVGFDGEVFSEQLALMMNSTLSRKQITTDHTHDLPGMIWEDRPCFPEKDVFEHPEELAGKSHWEKLAMVREKMKEQKVDYHLLSSLDDIAWLYNLRGADVEYNPVFLSYALVSDTKSILFTDKHKLNNELQDKLEQQGVVIQPYEDISRRLGELPENSSLLYSSSKISYSLALEIPDGCIKINDISIVTRLKAGKNSLEASHIRNAMVKDGVALVRFFRWLEQNIGKKEITEITLDQQLTKFRKQQEGFFGNSFSTIAGYKDHGAIVHYEATPETAYQLKPEGILLLDSGGQYMDGTTDITRTVSLGSPSKEEKRDFTMVLKGHIALSKAVFPESTKGFHLDSLARQFLWKDGKNYGHGTGHGVGYFLNVHEGPQGISPNPAVNYPLETGMILSNEPGFYRQGHYGIRTENLVMVVPVKETEYGNFLSFETLTVFPYDLTLIDSSLLCHEEIQWVNHYHQDVYRSLEQHLDEEEKKWLAHKTRAI